jgi:hypothetical protein
LEIEQVLVTPVAFEMCSDFFLGFFAAAVPVVGKSAWVAFTLNDCTYDGHTGQAGDVGNSMMDLHIHRVEGLVHPLVRLGALLDKCSLLPTQCP